MLFVRTGGQFHHRGFGIREDSDYGPMGHVESGLNLMTGGELPSQLGRRSRASLWRFEDGTPEPGGHDVCISIVCGTP